jgi:DNA-binding CsgD family transcriptional regulator
MQTALLERAGELAVIDAALEDAGEGGGRLVIVEGPAGIGKSSIVAEGRLRAAAVGMEVLQARGNELEASFSWGIVRQLFDPLIVQLDDRARDDLFTGAASRTLDLFRTETDEPGPNREGDVFALLHGLYWLTANRASARPLLLAIDDLHWADVASLRWISYLSRRLEGLEVCVLAAVRPLEDEDPLLVELLTDPVTVVVRPRELTIAAVTGIIRAGLPGDADRVFCQSFHRATNGNPLLVHELLRSLASDAVAPVAGSVEELERIAPDAIARSVRLRLARVSAEAVALAQSLAVLGDGTDPNLVAELAGTHGDALSEATAALAGVELLLAEPPLRFTHPLLRNAVYQGIAAHERPWAHARAATTLSSLGATTEAVAAQLLLAPAGAFEGAAATLREAARAAAAEGAPENAAKYLQRALEEPVEGDERGEILLELGEAETAKGVAVSALTSLGEALAHLYEADRRRQAWLRLGQALVLSERYEEAVAAFGSGMRERPGVADDLATRLEAEQLQSAIRLPDRQQDAYARLSRVDVSASSGIGAALLLGLQAYGDAARGKNRERAVKRAREALSAQPLLQKPYVDAGLDPHALFVLMSADLFAECNLLLEAAIAECRRRGLVANWSGGLMARSLSSLHAGALVDAETDARLALDSFPNAYSNFPHWVGWFVQILVERGAVEEADSALAATEERLGSKADDHWQLLRARGIVAAERRDHRTALAVTLRLGRLLDSLGVVNPAASSPGWRSEAALAHHALGETGEAVELAKQEVTLARVWGAPSALGRALRVLGLVEAGSAGIEHLREAVAILEESPARLQYAYAVADLGAALRRANQRRAARDLLRRALELAQKSGARRLAERTHADLIASGARPRRLEQSGVESLTPSERRVAVMAGEGLSNRQIAQDLFVTLRTVEMHLTSVFRKLKVSSRTQLAGVLDEASSAAA